jgi:predicted ABC-type ATPase
MFAGPNGSGESTLKHIVTQDLLGVYINPDDIERDARKEGFLNLRSFGITATYERLSAFFRSSTLLERAGLAELADSIHVSEERLHIEISHVNAYFASVMADFIRQELLSEGKTFTFETVMSSPDKVSLLQKAQKAGYRTYLYYIATEDPEINISRVRSRVRLGGHEVPEDKIISRYARSLDLLLDAIRFSNRAYIFDNSGEGEERIWIAEVTDGREVEMQTSRVPEWFINAVLKKIE